ncbi:MAG: hypothetical protein HY775_11825 [Acidobacteria bacterium]|nr:hypothetical protein [Acidobacteriota bacterium]
MRRRERLIVTAADGEGVIREELAFQNAWAWIAELRRHGFSLLEVRTPNGPAFVPGPRHGGCRRLGARPGPPAEEA